LTGAGVEPLNCFWLVFFLIIIGSTDFGAIKRPKLRRSNKITTNLNG
jgi:hypothetical protein